jgi:hypothetical protein
MSFDNFVGVMSDGVYNETGDVYLRFDSMGLLGDLGGSNNPVPPITGVPYGGMGTMSPLEYYQRAKLIERASFVWEDTTMQKKKRRR